MDLATVEAKMRIGDWEGAQAAAEAAIVATPTVARLHAYLGMCLFRKQDYAAAERAFYRACCLDPNLVEAGAKHAQCLDRLGRREDAFTVASQYIKLRPMDPTLQGLIHGLQHQVKGNRTERWEASRALDRRIIQTDG